MGSKVVVLGLGYVGLPLAVLAAESGHNVIGIDKDQGRIDLLLRGDSQVGDVTRERLTRALSTNFCVRDHLEEGVWDFAIIAVPTPLKGDEPDLSYVESAVSEILVSVSPGCCVILESTTYPGTTRDVVARRLFDVTKLGASELMIGFSPERIDPSNPTYRLENTPKITSGLTPEALDRVDGFYRSLGLETVRAQSCEAAELAKVTENTFRQVNIALVNEILISARAMNIDPWDALELAATKPFGFMPFKPGPGVGGHCLPIDPLYLAWASRVHAGVSMHLIERADEVNRLMPSYTASRALQMLEGAKGRRQRRPKVTIVGAAYKADTVDCRESPSFEVAENLERGGVEVALCDDLVAAVSSEVNGRRIEPLADGTLASSDLVVLITLHSEVDRKRLVSHSKLLLDTRNQLDDLEYQGSAL